MSAVPDRGTFENAYAGQAPWDIGRPQRAFLDVADRITGSVLDAGCGTGENALYFAGRGCTVTGIDFLEEPITRASRKATERGVPAAFLVKDALTLKDWSERFDNVIDSGLFHVFSDEDRRRYVEGLARVLKPDGRLFLLCFSDKEPGTQGPRRVPTEGLHIAFAEGWIIESIEPSRYEVRPDLKDFSFSEGGRGRGLPSSGGRSRMGEARNSRPMQCVAEVSDYRRCIRCRSEMYPIFGHFRAWG